MDFDLTDAQGALRDKAREVSLRDLAPSAAAVDAEQGLSAQGLARLAQLGMFGLGVPRAWGGAGADRLGCALVIEELASGCASTSLIVGMQSLHICEPILRFGTEDQKRRWLPALTSGATLGCLVRAGAAGASRNDSIIVRRDGDGWVIDGAAGFVHGSPVAEIAVVLAARPEASAAGLGLSAFIVPMDTPGLNVGPALARMGLRGAAAAAVTLDGVRVPASALLGTDGRGDEVARLVDEGGRIAVAALAIGIARAAFAATVRYVSDKGAHGRARAESQTIQFMLAEMSTQIDAARVLTWRAATDRAGGGAGGAAMAKLLACQAATRVSGDAVQALGSDGCLRVYPVERHFRDAKVATIFDGTIDTERLGIASVLLKD